MNFQLPDPDKTALYGLGILMVIAGGSKFFILDLWLGFEPQFVTSLIPLSSENLTLAGGIFELFLGLTLLTGRKTFYAASATTIWLTAITVQTINLGLWTIAIRDLGLSFYSLSVVVTEYYG